MLKDVFAFYRNFEAFFDSKTRHSISYICYFNFLIQNNIFAQHLWSLKSKLRKELQREKMGIKRTPHLIRPVEWVQFIVNHGLGNCHLYHLRIVVSGLCIYGKMGLECISIKKAQKERSCHQNSELQQESSTLYISNIMCKKFSYFVCYIRHAQQQISKESCILNNVCKS